MVIYDYDKSYSPPAPTTEIRVTTSLARQIDEGVDVSKEVKMILDTGADVSLIPKSVITELENLLGMKLPYKRKQVLDYSGERFFHKTYLLTLLPQSGKFGDGRSLYFLEYNGNEGILGRDVLNDYLICLNGPKLTWTLEK